MGDFYAQAKTLLKQMGNQSSKYQDAAVTAERLPFQLKEEFRKRQDPKMNQAIRSAEQNVLGGAIAGLNKYQNIQNPFARRDLAEQYQGSLSKTYTSLTDERARRQGVISDYINMWSGTYGAIAKGEQIKLSGLQQQYSGEMQMAGAAQSQSNWERSFARSGAEKEKNWTDRDTRKAINELKGAGKSWDEIAGYLANVKGIDVNEGSLADDELRRIHGYKPVGKTKETVRTPQQQHQDRYYNLLKDIETGKSKYIVDDKGDIIEQTGRGNIFKRNRDKIIMKK